VAVLGTLMPHLAAERHHIYRNATALALLAALLVAALGSLSIALPPCCNGYLLVLAAILSAI
jgi:hypothetical protein